MKRLATTIDDPLVRVMPLMNRWAHDIHMAQRGYDVFRACTGTFAVRNTGADVMNNLVWMYYFSEEYIGMFFEKSRGRNPYILKKL